MRYTLAIAAMIGGFCVGCVTGFVVMTWFLL